jgi:hypothetical protein
VVVCVRACVRACMRASVLVCVCVCVCEKGKQGGSDLLSYGSSLMLNVPIQWYYADGAHFSSCRTTAFLTALTRKSRRHESL